MTLRFANIIHFATADPASTIEFYTKLGFELTGEGENTAMKLEDNFLMWPIPVPGEIEDDLKAGEAVVVFYCDDVRAEHKKMVEAGIEFIFAPTNPYGPWEAHFRDPNGLWLMMIEPVAKPK